MLQFQIKSYYCNHKQMTGHVIIGQKSTESKSRVRSEEKLDEINAMLEHYLRKSLRHLAQETRDRFQVSSVSEKESQGVNVNMSRRRAGFVRNKRDHFRHLLRFGWDL
jgi:hypothetical protein